MEEVVYTSFDEVWNQVLGVKVQQCIDKLDVALENGLRSRRQTKILESREYVELYT
jgi:hypothetical protein